MRPFLVLSVAPLLTDLTMAAIGDLCYNYNVDYQGLVQGHLTRYGL